ncbi:hypothetical protein [Succinivibrio dextrinosolvens]|uniref:Uncharacterized protein n=1 Tax=Succinivibrio dextrinosolvens TaxID=83771 RepID=A0A662ZDK1_9GAMM|nr:hypothetical protein [Succinivibrio dextrinosolvens]SFK60745.1 hypothetical protein SAMN04487865_11392 [Succinivibrio dextrinosolvens]
MTDMDHKPNGWNLPINQMSDEEWKDYFECRKKFDISFSTDQRKNKCLEIGNYINEENKFYEEIKKLPLRPNIAITYKCFHGLKSMKDFNLSWAKAVYPDEF